MYMYMHCIFFTNQILDYVPEKKIRYTGSHVEEICYVGSYMYIEETRFVAETLKTIIILTFITYSVTTYVWTGVHVHVQWHIQHVINWGKAKSV